MKLLLRRLNPERAHAARVVGGQFAQARADRAVLGESHDESGLAMHVGAGGRVNRFVQRLNRFVVHASILLLFALPAQAQEPTPAFPNHTAQKVADVASYGTLGAELGLQLYDAIKAPDGGHQIAKAMFGLSAAWAGAGILKTVTQRARPCAPFCGHDDPYASFPSQHAWLACQALYGEHRDWKAWLAIATSVLRPLANKHHPTDVLAGCGFGWASTKVFP